MKINKRTKNEILRSSVIHIVLLLIFGAITLMVIYPKISEFSEKKVELVGIYDNLQAIQNTGISYTEFKTIAGGAEFSSDNYTKTLLRNITPKFFTENFSNTGSGDYASYIGTIEDEITLEKNSDVYIAKENAMRKILPVYSKDSKLEEANLSDFYFINYVENLIYSFNLTAEGEIGVGEIIKVDKSSANPNGQQAENSGTEGLPQAPTSNSLDEEIYKIPLNFDITGQKSDIIEFIHFFEHVGAISVDGTDFSIYDDNFINKVLDGEKFSSSYNIYDNQVADISSINMDVYPDSATIGRDDDPELIDLIKLTQARESFTVSIELNFYVAGIPGYRMQKYIQDVIADFNALKLTVEVASKKYTPLASGYSSGEKIQAVQAIQSLDLLLLTLQSEVQALLISSQQESNQSSDYEKAIEYREQIEKIEANYLKQLDTIEKTIAN